MSLDEAVLYFGSGRKLCQELGIAPQNYTVWKNKNKIPLKIQFKLHELTEGKLIVDEWR
jgi:hypothetical protein